MEKISGLVISYNEERNIAQVLGCMDFCDEILVIDSYSTDATVAIAKTFPNVKVIPHSFEDFTKQRNFALDAAAYDWVLFLDGDERITPLLCAEILAELGKKDRKDAYFFYRQFYFEGRPIRYSGTQTDKNYRLFRKSKCRYLQEKKVHETLEVHGIVGTLKHRLQHFSVADYESYRQKMLSYGRLKGEELYDKGQKYSLATQLAKTFFKFFKSYFLRLGILDGRDGYRLCTLQAMSVYETYRSLQHQWKTRNLAV